MQTESLEKCDIYADENLGLGFKASQDFNIGDIVLSEEPFAYQLTDSTAKERCHCCLKETENGKLLQCGKCKVTKYCSKACQLHHWKEIHKVECKIMGLNLQEPWFSTHCQLYLRILLLLDRFLHKFSSVTDFRGEKLSACRLINKRILPTPECIEDSNYPGIPRSHVHNFFDFVILQSNKLFLPQTLRSRLGFLTEHIMQILKRNGNEAGKFYVDANEFDESFEYICKAHFQKLNIRHPSENWAIVGIYPRVSLINHSCRPNCIISVNDAKAVEVRAVRFIRNGEPITISYVPLSYSISMRQRILQKKWHFACKCSRCRETMKMMKQWKREEEEDSNYCKKIIDKSNIINGTKKAIDTDLIEKTTIPSEMETCIIKGMAQRNLCQFREYRRKKAAALKQQKSELLQKIGLKPLQAAENSSGLVSAHQEEEEGEGEEEDANDYDDYFNEEDDEEIDRDLIIQSPDLLHDQALNKKVSNESTITNLKEDKSKQLENEKGGKGLKSRQKKKAGKSLAQKQLDFRTELLKSFAEFIGPDFDSDSDDSNPSELTSSEITRSILESTGEIGQENSSCLALAAEEPAYDLHSEMAESKLAEYENSPVIVAAKALEALRNNPNIPGACQKIKELKSFLIAALQTEEVNKPAEELLSADSREFMEKIKCYSKNDMGCVPGVAGTSSSYSSSGSIEPGSSAMPSSSLLPPSFTQIYPNRSNSMASQAFLPPPPFSLYKLKRSRASSSSSSSIVKSPSALQSSLSGVASTQNSSGVPSEGMSDYIRYIQNTPPTASGASQTSAATSTTDQQMSFLSDQTRKSILLEKCTPMADFALDSFVCECGNQMILLSDNFYYHNEARRKGNGCKIVFDVNRHYNEKNSNWFPSRSEVVKADENDACSTNASSSLPLSNLDSSKSTNSVASNNNTASVNSSILSSSRLLLSSSSFSFMQPFSYYAPSATSMAFPHSLSPSLRSSLYHFPSFSSSLSSAFEYQYPFSASSSSNSSSSISTDLSHSPASAYSSNSSLTSAKYPSCFPFPSPTWHFLCLRCCKPHYATFDEQSKISSDLILAYTLFDRLEMAKEELMYGRDVDNGSEDEEDERRELREKAKRKGEQSTHGECKDSGDKAVIPETPHVMKTLDELNEGEKKWKRLLCDRIALLRKLLRTQLKRLSNGRLFMNENVKKMKGLKRKEGKRKKTQQCLKEKDQTTEGAGKDTAMKQPQQENKKGKNEDTKEKCEKATEDKKTGLPQKKEEEKEEESSDTETVNENEEEEMEEEEEEEEKSEEIDLYECLAEEEKCNSLLSQYANRQVRYLHRNNALLLNFKQDNLGRGGKANMKEKGKSVIESSEANKTTVKKQQDKIKAEINDSVKTTDNKALKEVGKGIEKQKKTTK